MKTRKPTGDAECPPCVRRAHEINDRIQTKVSCRDLEDEDIIEINNFDHAGSDSDNEMSDESDIPADTSIEGPPPRRKPSF